jgi:hypothetical protein
MATNQNRASLIAASIGLSIIAFTASAGAAQPPTPAPAVSHAMSEDDPGWDCNLDGNRICGDPQGVHATEAWAAWDKTQAWKQLQVASSNVRVEYVGTATRYPTVDEHTELAVPARDGWYVFRGVLTDGK